MKKAGFFERYFSPAVVFRLFYSGFSALIELFALSFFLFPLFLSQTLELMLKVKIVFVFMAANVIFVSCRTTKDAINTDRPATATSVSTEKSSARIPAEKMGRVAVSTGDPSVDYINTYRDIAIEEMKRTGVPASITLAQGMLESDFGRSELARKGNNHFGIKCHNWNGASVYHNDDRRNDCFRKYQSAEESFRDHSDFIHDGSRYSFLFNLSPYDYKGWAAGLKKAGYATNPNYASLLVRKIEENNLYIYDKGYTAGRNVEAIPARADSDDIAVKTTEVNRELVSRVPRIRENNRIQYIIVKDGDTRDEIEKEFRLLRWELPRYNELGEEFSLSPGQILYLQPKRDKAEPGKEQYTFTEGDTMYLVSQKFGIKLKKLYEMNRLQSGTEPKPGTKLWLRGIRPVS